MSASEKRRLKRIRNSVIERDGRVCCYCDKELELKDITVDHIVPLSKHGTYNLTNLTVSCKPCNNKRGAQSFFEFAKRFNFSESKLYKYNNLYFNNLKIKVLNIAKEEFLDKEAIPQNIIDQACSLLKIKSVSFENWKNDIVINFNELVSRREIKFCFEKLIKIIELS